MGERPSGTTLDRIDGTGNYEPGNCRWATPVEQQSNMQSNRKITFAGETLTLAGWSRRLGFSKNTIAERIRRGMTEEQALTTPLDEAQRERSIQKTR